MRLFRISDNTGTEFAASVAAGYSIYSTLNSSPWTAQSFGGDPEKAKSCLAYARLAMVTNLVLGLFVTLLQRSVWPLLGFTVTSVEMDYLYRRAVKNAQAAGSTSWSDRGGSPTAPAASAAVAGGGGRPR